MSLSPGSRLGPYEILTPIGAGGMGEVYRAKDTKLKRDVALKVLPEAFAADPERMARFQREAEVLASLNHPNIAQIYGVEDRALVMELVEGESPKGPMPFDDAWKIASQIAAGLEYAHEKGIVHRDLKPANIKITPDGIVKLLDFGLAKAFTGQTAVSGNLENSPTLTLGATQVGVILGTAAYMAPEQAKGKAVDQRADIWSFGVVLYELLTGERLFTGDDLSDTLADVLKKQPNLDRVPVQARRLLRECLEKDPKRRLRDIGDAERVLIEELPTAPTLTGVVPPSRSRLSIISTTAAILSLLALGALAFVHFRETPPHQHTLSYTISAPEGSVVSHFAVSPDGRYVAIAARVKGKQQLWLRSLDSLEARPLSFTEDAVLPFWSPDTRYVAFFAQGKLKKVDIGGGPAQIICDSGSVPRGGSWGRDDWIVFSSTVSRLEGGIQRVPAGGGVPAVITKTKGIGRYPAFLPDGRHFLYFLDQQSPEESGIYFTSLDGKENRRVLADRSGVVFASDHLLFIRDNTLMAQPFDISGGRIVGPTFPIAESLSLSNLAYAPVSVSENGVLVYQRRAGTQVGSRPLVWHDRTGKILGQLGGDGGIPSISPDEKTVVFNRSSDASGQDLWLWDLARGTPSRFTSGPAASFSAIWSPKGDRIVFTHSYPNRGYELMQKAANGSGQEQLLLPVSGLLAAVNHWSRDSRFIIYTQVGSKAKMELWILPMDGGDHKPFPFLQTEFNEMAGQLSPDGRWMAYSSDESGAFEIYVRPFPPGEGKYKISTAGGYQPRWRGDGKELFYVGADGKVTSVSVRITAGPRSIFEAGPPDPLFDSRMEIFQLANVSAPNPVLDYDVTRDGKRFLITTSDRTSAPTINVEVNWTARLKK
jgi:serine/threonine protein kinase